MIRADSYLIKQAMEVKEMGPLYQRPVSGTVGYSSAPVLSAITGSLDPFRGGPSKNDLKDVLEYYGDKLDLPGLPLRVNLGEGHPIDDITRTWKNPNTSILTKLLGTVSAPISGASAALNRSDHYNPMAHSVTVFSKNRTILDHEMGHAKDFKERTYPGLYMLARAAPGVGPGVGLYQEALASNSAADAAKERGESPGSQQTAQRLLGGAFGTYVGHALKKLLKLPDVVLERGKRSFNLPVYALGGAALGQAVGHYAQPFGNKKNNPKEDKKEKKDKKKD